MILALVFVVFLSTNLSMVHTDFVTIPATYLNENVTKYNVRRIDLAIDPHPIILEPNGEVKIHFGMDLMKRVPENDDLKVNISITHIGQEKPIPCKELVSIRRIHIFIYYSDLSFPRKQNLLQTFIRITGRL